MNIRTHIAPKTTTILDDVIMKASQISAALLLACISTVATAQRTMTHERGWNAERVYSTGDVDDINLFNGNLTVAIPIGPAYATGDGFSYSLSLHYNSEIWDSEQICQNVIYTSEVGFGGLFGITSLQSRRHVFDGSGNTVGIVITQTQYLGSHNFRNLSDVLGAEHTPPSPYASQPACATITTLRERDGAAGLGWTLSLGRLDSPWSPPPGQAQSSEQIPYWRYVAPDGSTHRFYGRMRADDDLWDSQGGYGTQSVDGDGPTLSALRRRTGFESNPALPATYTQDGTYLRMRVVDTVTREIDFPNGEVHRFREYSAGVYKFWRLVKRIAPTCPLRDQTTGATNATCEAASNYLAIKYCGADPIGGDSCAVGFQGWELSDNYGRTHRIHYGPANMDVPTGHLKNVAKLVELDTTGAPKIFSLNYDTPSIHRATPFFLPPWFEPSDIPPHLSNVAAEVRLPTLMAVNTLGNNAAGPAVATWRFAYRDDENGHGGNPGSLVSLTKPTGGTIQWGYEPILPPDTCSVPASATPPYPVHETCELDVGAADGGTSAWGFTLGPVVSGVRQYAIARGYIHPTAGARTFNRSGFGVHSRTISDPATGGRMDRWIYAPYFRCQNTEGPNGQPLTYAYCLYRASPNDPMSTNQHGKEFANVVYLPGPDGAAGGGGKSVHYYSIYPELEDPLFPPADGFMGQEYGLPLTKRVQLKDENRDGILEDVSRSQIGQSGGMPNSDTTDGSHEVYLSTEFYAGGSAAVDSPLKPTGIPLRRQYVRYEFDPFSIMCLPEDIGNPEDKVGCVLDGAYAGHRSGFGEAVDLNRRLKASRAISVERADANEECDGVSRPEVHYCDDEIVDTVNEDFDGFGNYQTTRTRARELRNNGVNAYGMVRIRHTDYDFGSNSTYIPFSPTHRFVVPSVNGPWFLGGVRSTTVSDSPQQDGQDSILTPYTQPIHRTYCYDPDTGFVKRERIFARGTTPGANDIIVVNERSPLGANQYRITTSRYGGDLQTVPIGDQDLCSIALPSNPDSMTSSTYTNGTLSRSAVLDPTCGAEELVTLDAPDIALDGSVIHSFDSSGLGAQFSYDPVGRLSNVLPIKRVNGNVSSDTNRLATAYFYTLTPGTNGDNWVRSAHACQYLGTALSEAQCPRAGLNPPSNVMSQELYQFDAHGRVLQKGRRSGLDNQVAAQAFVYGVNSQLTHTSVIGDWTSSGELGPRAFTRTHYDHFGRPITTTTPNSGPNLTYFYFKGNSRKTLAADVWLDGRQDMCSTEGGGTECYFRQQKVTVTDPFGQILRVSDDSDARAENGATVYATQNRYVYNPAGQLLRASTGGRNGGEAQWRYYLVDGRGFLTAERNPEVGPVGNGWIRYQYDSAGRVHMKHFEDPNFPGAVQPGDLVFDYDVAGRLVRVNDATAQGGPRPMQFFVYAADNDQAGTHSRDRLIESRQINWQRNNHSTTVTRRFEYGGPGAQVSKITTLIDAPQGHWEFAETMTYDSFGRVSSHQYPQPACSNSQAGCGSVPSRTLSFGYDRWYAKSLSANVGSASSAIVSNVAYFLNDAIQSISHGNGATDLFAYENGNTGRLTRIEHRGAGRTTPCTGTPDETNCWTSGAFEYDGIGNIKSIGVVGAPNGAFGGDRYWYDRAGRLTRASLQAEGQSFVTRGYEYYYDRFGNMTNVKVDGVQRAPFPVADPLTNRLPTGTAVAYDIAGNQTRSNGYFLAYDGFGRMKQLCDGESCGPASIWRQFAYDTGGERVVIADRKTGVSTIRLRDAGNHVVREIEIGANGAWSWKRDFVFMGARQIASIKSGAQENVEHYHLDHLGSTRNVTVANGQITRTGYREFAPYGEDVTYQASELHQFTGHERDRYGAQGTQPGGQSDLDYMHARFYSGYTGQFLSVDPVRGDVSNPQSLNRYAYVAGNPIRFHDPSGMIPCNKHAQTCVPPSKLDHAAANALNSIMEDTLPDEPGVSPETVRDEWTKEQKLAMLGALFAHLQSKNYADRRCGGECPDTHAMIGGLKSLWGLLTGQGANVGDLTGLTPWGKKQRRQGWRDKGRPGGTTPQRDVLVQDRNTGQITVRRESKELHHDNPRRNDGGNDPSNLKDLWPTDHEAVDPHRKLNYDVLYELLDDDR